MRKYDEHFQVIMKGFDEPQCVKGLLKLIELDNGIYEMKVYNLDS
jgi:hypothetical protein